MTLNASLDDFFQGLNRSYATRWASPGNPTERLIAHLARDGFKILPAEEVDGFLEWREVAG